MKMQSGLGYIQIGVIEISLDIFSDFLAQLLILPAFQALHFGYAAQVFYRCGEFFLNALKGQLHGNIIHSQIIGGFSHHLGGFNHSSHHNIQKTLKHFRGSLISRKLTSRILLIYDMASWLL